MQHAELHTRCGCVKTIEISGRRPERIHICLDSGRYLAPMTLVDDPELYAPPIHDTRQFAYHSQHVVIRKKPKHDDWTYIYNEVII